MHEALLGLGERGIPLALERSGLEQVAVRGRARREALGERRNRSRQALRIG